MKRIYILEGLDCAQCAEEIRAEVEKDERVKSAEMNFMKQELTVEAENSCSPDELMTTVTKVVAKHEPDVTVKERQTFKEKKYIIDGLDCAQCAEEVREAVEKSDYANGAKMNFINKELTVTPSKIISDKELLKLVTATVTAVEPDVTVSEKENHVEKKVSYTKDIVKMISAGILFIVAFILEKTIGTEQLVPKIAILSMYLAAYVICGLEVAITSIKAIAKKNFFNENTLMLIASIGAIVLGEYEEAVAVMLFYTVGEFFQSIAVNKSRRSISSLIKTKPETADVLIDGEYITVDPENVETDSIIRVKPGEKIPLDGIVESGNTSIDTSALTGESLPRDITIGDEVPAGAINISGVITLKTTRRFTDSTVYKMLQMVESAVEKKTKTENFISVFAKYYTPIVVLVAVIISIFPPLFTGFNYEPFIDGIIKGKLIFPEFTGFDFVTWVQRGLIFLVISCPCALVISVPLGYFAGIGKASSKGILVKGSNYLEAISKAKVVLFDKTGTLTKGQFEVTRTEPAGMSKDELLRYAAYAESNSNHPIAVSVRKAYGADIDQSQITQCSEIAGKGIKAVISGVTVLCGNSRLMADYSINCPEANGTVLYVAVDNKYAGLIEIADMPKEHSAEAVKMLKNHGVKVVMLTGDNKSAAAAAAEKLGITDYYAELLPENKSEITLKMKSELPDNEKVMFVGDGINDAPVIASADIGVAMGGSGADSAIETADCVLMKDDPMQLADAFAISKKTNRIVLQNIIFALGVKLIIQVLGVLGLANMWAAVFADVGVSIIAIFNSLRLMRK
ncbi:MAG: heavy metal translocating P-type ATPase [[Eubacterium] siraeum]|jgi:cadmium-exporting ATPase|nr:heavy metal translocating P-type ATPase [[Eubacterium] siraeum]